jgi:cation transport regulator ChaB
METTSQELPLSVTDQIYANNEAFSKEFADAWNAYLDKMLKKEELKCQH